MGDLSAPQVPMEKGDDELVDSINKGHLSSILETALLKECNNSNTEVPIEEQNGKDTDFEESKEQSVEEANIEKVQELKETSNEDCEKDEEPNQTSNENNLNASETDNCSQVEEASIAETFVDEELHPDQIPDPYTDVEGRVFDKLYGPAQPGIQYSKIHCTACNVHLGSAVTGLKNRYIHPILKVLICKSCYEFYGSGEFEKDEDGSEFYCRWCGQGGNVLCCSQCPVVFCRKCIRNNLGRRLLARIRDSEEWDCFVCNPIQIMNLRIRCRALYDYSLVQKKLALENGQPELLTKDFSTCCMYKLKTTTVKRKQTSSDDEVSYDHENDECNNDDEDNEYNIYHKKKKLKTFKVKSFLPKEVNENQPPLTYANNKSKLPSKIWDSQVEDEVVCTPDLSMLMSDEEDTTPPSPPPPDHVPPPLTYFTTVPTLAAISTPTLINSNVQYVAKTTTVPAKQFPYQYITTTPSKNCFLLSTANPLTTTTIKTATTTTRPLTTTIKTVTTTTRPLTTTTKAIPSETMQAIKPNLVHFQNPAIKFHGNNSNRPLLSISNSKNRSVIDAMPAKLAPGLKHAWFEKATKMLTTINNNISTKIASLCEKQSSVSNLEELANVHNELQKMLSNSINVLLDVRRDLRGDFINDLRSLQFCNNQNNVESTSAKSDDNDVVLVSYTKPTQRKVLLNVNKSTGFIRVKPAAALLDSSVIIIPDDAKPNNDNSSVESTENTTEIEPNTNAISLDNETSQNNQELPAITNKEESATGEKQTVMNGESHDKEKNETGTPEIPEGLDPGVLVQIRKAIIESKFERIVDENSKLNAPNIRPELVKRMLQVRVVVETNFGSKTLKPKGYIPMKFNSKKEMEKENQEEDIENVLSKSVIVNKTKGQQFFDDFSKFVNNSMHGQANDNNQSVNGSVPSSSGSEEDCNSENSNSSNNAVQKSKGIPHDPQTTDSGIDVDGI